jgi:hypothetical protein
MNDLDRKIQAALRRDNAGESLADEPNIAEEVITAFRSRHRWLYAFVIVAQIAALIGLVLASMRFYQATDVTAQLRWGGLSLVLFMAISMIKIWFWLEMQSNRVLREVKRVELLLVSRPSN